MNRYLLSYESPPYLRSVFLYYISYGNSVVKFHYSASESSFITTIASVLCSSSTRNELLNTISVGYSGDSAVIRSAQQGITSQALVNYFFLTRKHKNSNDYSLKVKGKLIHIFKTEIKQGAELFFSAVNE